MTPPTPPTTRPALGATAAPENAGPGVDTHPGDLMHGGDAQASDLRRYLQLLAGDPPAGRLIEIRYRTRDRRMRQLFIPARRLDLAQATITRLNATAEVYVGVLLRTRRRGTRDALAPSHLVFVDIDQADAQTRIESFPHAPTAIIASGTPGHRHAYYALRQAAPPDAIAAANRRLAHALNGDPAATDAARMLRPPAVLSRKRTPPSAVVLVDLNPERRYPLEQLILDLPDPSPRRPAAPHPAPPHPAPLAQRSPVDQRLRAIPTSEYVHRLTGRHPSPAGKIHCPFHDDRTPSLHCYGDGTWYCFGCARGGTIYDFAANLWINNRHARGKLRGSSFISLREQLTDQLLTRQSHQTDRIDRQP